MAEITLNVQNLINFTEAAEILQVSRPTVYNLVARFKLYPVAIGRNRYLLREDVEQLKERLKQKTAGG